MKPWGIFSPEAGIPDGASFALLYDSYGDGQLAWCRAYAEGRNAAGRPFVWVLYTRGEDRAIAWVPALWHRLKAAGLLPYIAAMAWQEEWYAGLPSIEAIDARCAFVGQQQAVLKEYFPAQATVTINAFTCPAKEFGPVYYSPEPAHTDIRGVYTYVPVGQTWESMRLEHKLRLSCGYRVGPYQLPEKRVVLIAQAFRIEGDPLWGEWPAPEVQAHAARWAAHEQVIAVWPFDKASRDGGFQGWDEWPERHTLAAMGVE